MDYRLAMMCGNDLPIPQCQIIVHQPRIKEIGMIGEQDFFIGAQCLTINSSMFIQDKALLPEINNFQIFMTIMNEKESRDKKESTMQVLQILFPEKIKKPVRKRIVYARVSFFQAFRAHRPVDEILHTASRAELLPHDNKTIITVFQGKASVFW